MLPWSQGSARALMRETWVYQAGRSGALPLTGRSSPSMNGFSLIHEVTQKAKVLTSGPLSAVSGTALSGRPVSPVVLTNTPIMKLPRSGPAIRHNCAGYDASTSGYDAACTGCDVTGRRLMNDRLQITHHAAEYIGLTLAEPRPSATICCPMPCACVAASGRRHSP